jgi:hypothetical protein
MAAWIRLDSRFNVNRKIVELSDRQYRSWVAVLLFCAENDRESSRITLRQLRGISGVTTHVLKRFVELDLLDPTDDPKVYEVHGWEDYNPSDRTAADRMRRYRDRHEGVTSTVTRPVTQPSPTNTIYRESSFTRPGSSAGLAAPRGSQSRPSDRCPECLQPIGHGHLDDCPLMPATLPDWEPEQALDSGGMIPPETTDADEADRNGDEGTTGQDVSEDEGTGRQAGAAR